MDKAEAKSPGEVAKELALDGITDRPWTIQKCSAMEGWGVHEGLNWLTDIIKRKK